MIHQVGPVHIRVFGEPQPFPKKDVAIVQRLGQSPRLVPVAHDYRTRTNPHTHKIEKYDKGYKAAWMKNVTQTVHRYMTDRDLETYPKNHPVAMSCLFFLSKSPSCKLWLPSQAPDEDNLIYAVRNALKRTPDKKGKPGRYPDGVLFWDDDQIIWRVGPEGMVWATEKHPPGVLITVQDALQFRDEIEQWQPLAQTALM